MALFEAANLHKRFGDRIVLQDLSLAFEEGKLSGIMGPNGAGKTTCFNVLTGRFAPDRGTVRFAGVDITGEAPRQIARRGISRSFQSMNLFDDCSALDNVILALPEVRARGFDVWRDLRADTSAEQHAAAVLAKVGLAGKEHAGARGLSYGERRALEIAVGFVMAFLASLVVVRPFLRLVGRSGFAPFAWYRIAAGAILLGLIAAGRL